MIKSILLKDLEKITTQDIIDSYHHHNKVFENKRNKRTKKNRIKFYRKTWIDLNDLLQALSKLNNTMKNPKKDSLGLNKSKQYISVEEHNKKLEGYRRVVAKVEVYHEKEIRKLSKFETDRIKKLKAEHNKEIKEMKEKVTKWCDLYFTVTSGRHKLFRLMELRRENDDLKQQFQQSTKDKDLLFNETNRLRQQLSLAYLLKTLRRLLRK